MMTEVRGLIHCISENLLRIIRQLELAADRMSLHRDSSNHFAHARGFQSKFAQDTSRDASIFFNQSNQKMFGADAFLMRPFGLLMSEA